MRAEKLVNKGSPCDRDFTDNTIQTSEDFLSRPKVYCTNLNQCQSRSSKENVMCSRGMAIQMARFILQNKKPFEEAVQEAREELLSDDLEGTFWVFRDSRWQIVKGKAKVIHDIVEFAKTIIDFCSGDRRPFTQDGKHIEDVYCEVGQTNPFR